MSSSAPQPPSSDPSRSGSQPVAGSGYPLPTGPPPAGRFPPADSTPESRQTSPTPESPPRGPRPETGSPVAGAHKFDLGQIGLGVLMLIASMMPFYSYSMTGGGLDVSDSLNAWHGFFGWFGVVLGVVAAGVLAASVFTTVAISSMRLIVLGLFAASAVCLIVALFVVPGGDFKGLGIELSSGHSFGYWLALLASLAATALAVLRKNATDTSSAD